MITSRTVSLRRLSAWRAGAVMEALEERRLLSARFVMPLGVPIDNTTTFSTLDSAMNAAGLAAGDVIQIEPGSAPGELDEPSPLVANLTIQGDPTAALASIPMFTLDETFTVSAAQSGFALKNVNVGLIFGGNFPINFGGNIVGTGNITISGSSIVNISSSIAPAITLGGAANVIVNSTFVNDPFLSGTFMQVTTPVGGSNNIISRNTFVMNSLTLTNMLAYALGTGAAVTDKVDSNTFVAATGSTPQAFCLIAESGLSGLTVSGNSFSSSGNPIAIHVAGAPQNLTITNNTISQAGGFGIFIDGSAGTTTGALIFNNQIRTATGTGLALSLEAATAVLNINIEGNDFHANAIGVLVTGSGAGSLAGIDLGGGSRGSVGGNNFRSFTAAGVPSAAAICTSSVSTATGTISAQKNLFALGATPSNVIYDPSSKVVVTNPLAGNAAFVQTLYENFLKRPGNTASQADAGFWVNAITGGSMTAAQAAASISRSPEALGVLVDGLYGRYLGRLPDAGGRAYFIGVLQGPGTSGGGVEGMVTQLVTSAEYAQQFGSDGNFVQSLYTRLLGRLGSASDVTFWTNTLAAGASRASVASSFLGTSEFRGDVVRQFYGFSVAPLVATASIFLPLLDRAVAPGASEINFWANSGQDLLAIETGIVQTGEYFTNG